jgi:hypothetical protein
MPESKRDDGPRGRKGGDKGKRHKRREEPPVQRNPDADPVKIHREYVERRLSAGAPAATHEAYARAIKQWNKLPGAVPIPPTELTEGDAAPDPPSKTGESRHGESAS